MRNKIPFYLFALLLLAASCSNIDEADRLVPVGGDQPADTIPASMDAVDSLYDAPVSIVPRRVLIEDYTGQKCANCPDATTNIHQLQQVYGSLIVPVAIQSEYMGMMEPEGLGNELGNTYFNSLNFTPKVKPAVQVSRFYGEVLTSNTDVNFYVDNVVLLSTPLDVRLKAKQNADNPNKANIDIKVICADEDHNAVVNGKLQVWITEDSIVAPQDYLNGQHFTDYVHNHVLRATVNGDWGENVSVNGWADEKEFHYTATLQSNWNPRHLAIVAFVYNDEEVVQVVRQELRVKN